MAKFLITMMKAAILGSFFIAIVDCYISFSGKASIFRNRILHSSSSVVTTHKASTSDSLYVEHLWRQGFKDCSKEVSVDLSGSFPVDLEGIYYRNSGGKFSIGQNKVVHPFDSDGMISAISFKAGKASFRNQFVGTEEYIEETKQNRICYRSVFGTQRAGGMLANIFDCKVKNPANTNILPWNNELYALWEAGSPYQLDPTTLETLGKSNLHGILPSDAPLAAHYRIDPKTGRLVMFSAQPNPLYTTLTIYEFNAPRTEKSSTGDDQQSFELYSQKTVQIPAFALFHDFVVTKHFYAFVRCPLSLQPLPFLFGQQGLGECVDYDHNKPAEVILIPRASASSTPTNKPTATATTPHKDEFLTIPIDNQFNFHFVNGFDSEDEEQGHHVILDVISSDKMYLGKTKGCNLRNRLAGMKSTLPIWQNVQYKEDIPFSRLVRYNLSLPSSSSSSSSSSFQRTVLSDDCVEFPVVHPSVVGQEHRFVYCNTGQSTVYPTPFQGILKYDNLRRTVTERWHGKTGDFLSEPVFAPRSSSAASSSEGRASSLHPEEDGYLLTITTNPLQSHSELLIFRADQVGAGPIQRIPLPVYLSYGLHGTFAPFPFSGSAA